MQKVYIRFCDLCGIDFRALSPFAKACPKCKEVRFKKPGPMDVKTREDIIVPPSKILDLALKGRVRV